MAASHDRQLGFADIYGVRTLRTLRLFKERGVKEMSPVENVSLETWRPCFCMETTTMNVTSKIQGGAVFVVQSLSPPIPMDVYENDINYL